MPRRRLADALSELFRVEPGEGLRVGLMFLYSVAIVGGVIITGQLASRSLFLSNLPSSAVPIKFIVPPVATVVVVLLYTRVASLFRRDRLIVSTCALMLAVVVAFRVLLTMEFARRFWFLGALYVTFDVISTLAIIQFWTFAGDLFNTREAKRLFGLISGGGTLASALFGGVMASAARSVAPENLLFVMMAGLVLSGTLVRILGAKHPHALQLHHPIAPPRPTSPGPTAPERTGIRATARAALRSKLVVAMAGILVVASMITHIAEFQIDLALQINYGADTAGMVGFLGSLRFWAGLVAAALQFFLAARLMERFGVLAALLLLPSAIAFGSVGILVTGGAFLWIVAIPRASDFALKYTIHDPSFNLLYLPVLPRLRGKMKAMLDGVVKPCVLALLGLLFLGVTRIEGVTLAHWSFLALALVVCWILLVSRASRQYVAALSESIRQRRLDPGLEAMDIADETTTRVLVETLRHEDSALVLHALSLLRSVPDFDWPPHVLGLLDHESAEVRVLAIECLGEQGSTSPAAASHAERVRELLGDPTASVRAAAVETVCALEGPKAIRSITPFLEDPSAAIRAAAVIGMLKHCGLDGFLHAAAELKELLESEQAEARLQSIHVLEAIAVKSFYRPLADMLQHEALEVRVAATRASAAIGAPELVPHLLPQLRDVATRADAGTAILGCLDTDLSAVATFLGDEDEPANARAHLAGVLAKEGSPDAFRILARHVDAPIGEVRGAVVRALLALQQRSPDRTVESDLLRAAVDREFRRAYQLDAIADAVEPAYADPLLCEALALRRQQAVDRVLVLVAMMCPDLPFDSVTASLAARDPRLRANAIELLDNIAEGEIKELLLPLLSASRAETVELAIRELGEAKEPAAARLAELGQSKDVWLRCCAIAAIGTHAIQQLAPTITLALEDADPIVRETAAAALRTIAQEQSPMAMSTIEIVLFLKSVPLFEKIPAEIIAGMVPIAQSVRFEQGDTFIHQGEEGHCLYIIVDGDVEVVIDGERKSVLHSKAIIGELAVLSEKPRNADCKALTDVVALRIEKNDFWQLMTERPEITTGVLKRLVVRYL